MPRITISYRRADSAGITGRIYDRLVEHFGESSVVIDVDNVPLGADFRRYIDAAVRRSDFLLAVIGPNWLGERDGAGRRIDDADDPVRVEVAAALRNESTRVIPLLVEGTSMPSPGDLPEELHPLCSVNGAAIFSGKDFAAQMGRVICAIEETVSEQRPATFLFTDIEGSTRAWEQHPDAMASALADHDKILQRSVDACGGEVFKTVGDAFCCVFSDSRAAVTAAVECMRALQSHRWPPEIGEVRVRMALHAGSALRRGGDYFGPAVNRVARLLAIAHGGQILASSALAGTFADAPAEGVSLRDLGAHRLKDLARAETVYQVMAAGLRADFPTPASLDAHPNNLPSQMSSFVGRTAEIARLRKRLGEHRVVTIAGAGGIGKTRLALQLAAEVVEEYAGGVYFVALAPVSDGTLIVNALAAALRVTELGNEPLETTVVRYIGTKPMLLVFDNSEHVLVETAALVKRIESECPNARCLVTSREPLHLTGECVERLNPLATPVDAASVGDLEAVAGSLLFLERARSAAGGELSLSATDCALIAAICRRLDGIPLAIELAASRLATTPLRRLADRLSAMRLASKDSTVEERHRTLRAAIEWSHDMLADSEKQVFRVFAVFHGGSTVEALEYVADADVDDDVATLVDKSLVQLDLADEEEPRYRLLDPIAEFARLQLEESGLGESLRRHHFEYYAALAAPSERVRDASRFAAIDRDIANVRFALEWGLARDAPAGLLLANDLASYWRTRGALSEGRSWLERARSVGTALDSLQAAKAARESAVFATMQDDYAKAEALAQTALTIFRELGHGAGIGGSLHVLAEIAHRQGRYDDAERLYRESFEHLEASNHIAGKTICLMNEGLLARDRARYADSLELLDRAGNYARELGDRSLLAQVEIERAWTMLEARGAEAAIPIFRETFRAKVAERDAHGACQARIGVATAAFLVGEIEVARDEFMAALGEAQALGAQIFVIDALYGLAALRARDGDLLAAATCCGLAARLVSQTGCEERTGILSAAAFEKINEGLTPEERGAAISAAATMQPEDALRLCRR